MLPSEQMAEGQYVNIDEVLYTRLRHIDGFKIRDRIETNLNEVQCIPCVAVAVRCFHRSMEIGKQRINNEIGECREDQQFADILRRPSLQIIILRKRV